MNDEILKNLNEKQMEAVTTTAGPVLIIAGAGSGKTRALTHRIAYLIKHHKVNPWNILGVTFTNKAAAEMQKRVFKLLYPCENGFPAPENLRNYDLPMLGTFHSICVRILRKEAHLLGYENSFTIYDAIDSEALVKQVMKDLQYDPKAVNPRAVLSHISGAKNELMDWEDYEVRAHNYFTEKVAKIYKNYQKRLRRNQAMDFDDLIMQTVSILRQYPDVLDKYQEKFKFILVDEYQDTNHAQYTLVELLAQKYRNICVVGDSDQSIYSWRGANMQNILDFEKDYPDAKAVFLEQNYRSTPVILDAAHDVIVKNRNRKDKKMWTEREGGELIRIWTARDELDEGEMIAREIEDRIRGHECPDYRDFVALYRTNAQSRVLEEVFMRYGIPYRIIGGVKFYQRKEIKDLLAYLRVIHNPHDTVSLLRIINVPARNIGAKTIEVVQEYSARHQMSFWDVLEAADELQGELPESKIAALRRFVAIIKDGRKFNSSHTASGVINEILVASKYKDFLLDGSDEGEIRFENVLELISVSSKYDRLEPGISLSTFLEEVSLISDLDSLDEKDNAVTFMTLHSAKGLEFPCVFVCGLEEGIFPHSRSLLDPQEMEEERRLMYVGMTRAVDELFLLHAERRMLYGDVKNNAASQFLLDLPDELVERNSGAVKVPTIRAFGHRSIPVEVEEGVEIEMGIGDRVFHKFFGQGVVTEIVGGVITVAFDDRSVGVKKLAASIAPLERIFD
ncbi:MAG: UvrD-helicase domain-containing protein [Patescibacteria group bacterium]|nr:UvrD-helicase domain-containing protein [Patescibacteria group bacterium]